MGGHGALLIASHYVDSVVAVLPAMGWMRLSTYGGEHAFKEALSFSNAPLRALLSAGEEQYAADLYHENLLGVPFLARVASQDESVPRTSCSSSFVLLGLVSSTTCVVGLCDACAN